MIIYKNDSLLKANEKIIAHGCNTKGVMGAGVAKLIKVNFPEAYRYYIKEHNNNGLKLGDVHFVETNNNKIIANCITQENYGKNGVFVKYDAIKLCLKNLYDFATKNNFDVAIPMIGSGLGGGDWNHIETLIDNIFFDYKISVYYI